MASIIGTPGDDIIRTAAAGGSTNGLANATNAGDSISAAGGNDLILAGAGPDTLFGDGGDDTIEGGLGSDLINGGPGVDAILAGDDNDLISVLIVDGTDPANPGVNDVGIGEIVDGGDGFEDTLVLNGLNALAPLFDLTSWEISNVEVLEVFGSTMTVKLTAAQLSGFDAIGGAGGTLSLGDPVGLPQTYSLLGKLLGPTTPFARVVIDSAEADVIVLDHVGNDVIVFEGGWNDVIYLPGTASDYQGFTAGAPSVAIFAADGTQLYEIVGGGDIGFVNDTPIAASDDVILATINAPATGLREILTARLLENDTGPGLVLVSPSAGDILFTDAGGSLFPLSPATGLGRLEDPVQRLDYAPPTDFSGTDTVTYEVIDVLGRTTSATIFFEVTNNAPVAPDFAYTVAPGSVLPISDILSQVSDADGDAVLFNGYSFFTGEIDVESVFSPGTGEWVGLRVTPAAGQVSSTITYIVVDDSGAIGNVGVGDITITFSGTGPGIARDDALRGTIGGGERVAAAVLTANDDAGVTITGLVGGTLSGDSIFLSTVDAVTGDIDGAVEFSTLTGNFLYRGFDGEFSFAYEAEDALGNATTATVTVTVDNNAPSPVNLSFVLQRGVAQTFLSADIAGANSDPDGDPLAVSAIIANPAFNATFIDPAFGTVVFGSGGFTITPTATASGSQTLTYSLVDLPDLGGATRDFINQIGTLTFTIPSVPPPPPPPPSPLVSIAATRAAVAEGNSPTGIGNGMLEFAVTRTGDFSAAATVTFTVGAAAGSGVTASDIHLVAEGGNGVGSGFGTFTATFAAGQDVERIVLIATGDRVPEADEEVLVTLTGGTGITLSPTGTLSATGTIVNDDVFPEVFFSVAGSPSGPEGNPPFLSAIPLTLSRVGDLSFATEVTFSVAGIGTATAADVAFVADGGTPVGSGFGSFTVTFEPGEQSRTINIVPASDRVPEPDEQVSVTLTGAAFGTLSTTAPIARTVTIVNDDVFPTVVIAPNGPPSVTEGNAGPGGVVSIVIGRVGDLGYETEVTFSVAGLGGTTADDIAFVASGGTPIGSGFGSFAITFAPGEQARIINIVASGDAAFEPDESFLVTLLGADRGTLATTGPLSVTGTFLNDDAFGNAAPSDIALTNASVLEALPAGTLVGLLSATDADAGETFAFSFAPGAPAGGNAGGLFRIDGNRLLTDAALDHEAAATRGITLRVTDSAGNTHDEAFTIAVGNVAEGGPGDPVAPVTINGPGFSISNGNTGTPATATPGGPALGTGTLSGAVDTAPITLAGDVTRARIENEESWNGLKNLVLGPAFWSPALGTDVLVANFVDVRWDLSTAPALDFDLLIVGAKRGAVTLAGGDDVLTWAFHSNEGVWANTATVAGGAGNDTLAFTATGLSAVDDALLADNAEPANGPLWNPGYDGRFSTALADGGAGDDVITAAARVRLVADGGVGDDALEGGARNDVLRGGDGNDVLTGGLGGDRFVFDAADGADAIIDFSRAQGDRVVLEGPGTLAFSGTGFTFGATSVTATNGHAWSAADFLFA